MNRFTWATARTIAEAAAAASTIVADAMTALPETAGPGDGTIVKAGGIDILDLLKENLLVPARVASLRDIPDLDAIVEEADSGCRLGAMATLAGLAAHPLLRQRYPAVTDAAGQSASPQIRNLATLGGNLLQRPRCWYFRAAEYRCLRKGGGNCFAIPGENQYHAIFGNRPCAIVHPSTVATALVALGATVDLIDAEGAVRRLSLEDFFLPPERDLQRENDLRPHEILTAINLPPLPTSARMVHLRQGEKDAFDWPLADVAVLLDLSPEGICRSASIVLGAAAPVPHRAKPAENALLGKHIDESTAGAAARAALAGATPLAKNAYKTPLFEALIRRALLKAAAPIVKERG